MFELLTVPHTQGRYAPLGQRYDALLALCGGLVMAVAQHGADEHRSCVWDLAAALELLDRTDVVAPLELPALCAWRTAQEELVDACQWLALARRSWVRRPDFAREFARNAGLSIERAFVALVGES